LWCCRLVETSSNLWESSSHLAESSNHEAESCSHIAKSSSHLAGFLRVFGGVFEWFFKGSLFFYSSSVGINNIKCALKTTPPQHTLIKYAMHCYDDCSYLFHIQYFCWQVRMIFIAWLIWEWEMDMNATESLCCFRGCFIQMLLLFIFQTVFFFYESIFSV
jgi:hypothetical protein